MGVTLASAIERASQALPDTQRSQLKFLAEKISQVVTRLQAEETRRKAAEAQVEELRRELRHWRQHASSIRDKYVVAAKESGVNPQTLEDTLQREEALKVWRSSIVVCLFFGASRSLTPPLPRLRKPVGSKSKHSKRQPFRSSPA